VPLPRNIEKIPLEDESGLLDLVVKPDVYARLRPVLSGRAVSVLVWEAEGLTH
jgi:hypothetical protein